MRQVVLDRLDELGLKHMRRALEKQYELGTHTHHSFEDRLCDLIEYERIERDERRMKERIRKAGFSQDARLEEIDSLAARGIDRSTLELLGQENWVKDHRNLAVTGAAGVGKTFLACAAAQRACQFGYSARFFRLPRLLQELEIARAEGAYFHRLTRLARIDVLILDDWGIAALTAGERRDLLELLDDRYQKTSTVVVAQMPVESWHEWIGDPALADAILDRLVHNAYRLSLKGESQRKMRGLPKEVLR
jgi:DNA replication protein DnaC